MSDKQGRGPYYDDGRVEKETKRPDEHGPVGGYQGQKPDLKIEEIRDQTRKDIRKNL